MSPEQAVTKLQTFYGKKLTDGQVAFYADALSSFNFNLLNTAINRCFREHKQFPTTTTILKHLMEARDIESRKEKKAEPKTTHEPQEPSKPADPEYVKESFRLLYLAWKQGKTNQEWKFLVAQCSMMERTWPGLGWGPAAKRLEHWYATKGRIADKE